MQVANGRPDDRGALVAQRAGIRQSITKFVGLDVSKDTIPVAVADAARGQARFMGSISNTLEAVRKLVRRLSGPRLGY